MSMTLHTLLEIIWTSGAYCLVMFLLPWLFFRKTFKKHGFSMPERIMGYFLSGQFYIIYLVFLLEYLHISYGWTLVIGTLLPFPVRYVIVHRKDLTVQIEKATVFFQEVVGKERSIKAMIVNGFDKARENRPEDRGKRFLKCLPDIILVMAVIAGLFYIFGQDTLTYYGYKASDVPVHNYWINAMVDNDIFVAGVYPHGFHCTLYYIHAVFGIETYEILRVFGFIETVFVYLSLLVSLRALCKSRFAPYIGMMFFMLPSFIGYYTYWRYSASLPQEYGMMFMFPAVYFAIRFFTDLAQANKIEDQDEQKARKKRNNWYLAGFIISFSLTITVHFYDTIPTGFFCIGIALGFCFRFFRWRYFKRIMLAGVISIAVAVLPLAVGYALGHPLQGSLNWAISIMGGSEEETETTATEITTAETETTIDNSDTTQGGTETGTAQTATAEPETEPKVSINERISSVLNDIVYVLSHSESVFPDNELACWCLLASIPVLLLIGLVNIIFRKTDYGAIIWTTAFSLMPFLMFAAPSAFGLPRIMETSRLSIFLVYAMAFAVAIITDGVAYTLLSPIKKELPVHIMSFLMLAAGGFCLYHFNLIRSPFMAGELLESNAEITCIANILRDEETDYTWTIVSANDALRMTEDYGWHYETITFLQEMENYNDNMEVTIPTATVYFFIEKIPINYAVGGYTANGEVSEEGASMDISYATGLDPYKGTNRWVAMSRMYYWAQAFAELYPNEMEVYYEDDTFICYKIEQNVYSLYNFAIDYEYNVYSEDE